MNKPVGMIEGYTKIDENLEFLYATLCQAQICTCDPIEVAIEKVHKHHDAGTSNGWQIDEKIAPVPCADNPNRKHYMLVC